MTEKDADQLCELLNQTYNTYWVNQYPALNDIFTQVRDIYEKYPNKFKKANKTLLGLIYNLNNPNQPTPDYITGPGEISKWESVKHNKIIYLFGENDHGNKTGCKNKINLTGRKHMSIEKYILKLIETSPVFIDFYVEFGVMLDYKEQIYYNSGQTLWDMLAVVHQCFGPVIERDCPYPVRMHGVDSRSVQSSKYQIDYFSMMNRAIMMMLVFKRQKRPYLKIEKFKSSFKTEIKLMSTVKTNQDLIRIMKKNIKDDKLVMKELKRSTLSEDLILDFFGKHLDKELAKIPYAVRTLDKWFNYVNKTTTKIWPADSDIVSYIITVVNAIKMDVYAVARMFKVFNVKESEHYPKEPQNIIYYAGTGHTHPMGEFLKELNFTRTEHSNMNILSCASMDGIKQPLFSL